MRIRSIRIQNLNSLRGESLLDFTAPPLSDTGLFAITGDTGAGKTTILDAVTLALFGKTSRGHESEVMSYGTGECLAEVEFSAGNDTYRARWATHRARKRADGNLQPAQRDLAKRVANGEFELLTDKIRELNSSKDNKGLIEEICGLNYEQFIRSVLLAQGQFAAFLQAKEGDRSLLLERITGTDIYTRLSKAAFQRHKIARDRLTELVRELKHYEILAPEAEDELHAQRKAVTQSAREHERRRKDYEAQLAWLEAVAKWEKQKADAAVALQELRQRTPDIDAQRARLDRHTRLLPLRTDLQRHDDQTAALTALQTEIAELQTRNHQAQAALAEQRTRVQSAETALTTYANTWKSRHAELLRAEKLDVQRAALRTPLARDQRRLAQLRAEQRRLSAEAEQLEQTIARNAQQHAADKAWLDTHRAYAQLPADIVRIERCRADLKRSLIVQRDTNDASTTAEAELQKLTEELTQNETLQAQQRTELTELQQQFDALLPEALITDRGRAVERLEESLTQLRQQQQLAEERQRIDKELGERKRELEQKEKVRDEQRRRTAAADERRAALSAEVDQRQHGFLVIAQQFQPIADRHNALALRRTLEPEQPCAVCGSVHHPYAERAAAEHAEFEQRRAEYQRHRNELDAAMKALDELLTEQRINTRTLTDLNETVELAEQRLSEVQGRLRALGTGAEARPPETPAAIRTRIEREQRAVQQARQLARQLDNRQAALAKAELAREQLRGRESLLRARLDGYAETLARAKAEFSDSETCLNDLLQPYGRQFDMATAGALFDELNGLAVDYTTRKDRLRDLDIRLEKDRENRTKTVAQLQDIERTIAELIQEITQRERELQALDAERLALVPDEDIPALREAGEARLETLAQTLKTATAELRAAEQAATRAAAALRTQTASLDRTTTALAALIAGLTTRLAEYDLADFAALRTALLDEATEQTIRAAVDAHRQSETQLTERYAETERQLTALRARPRAEADEARVREQLAAAEAALRDAQLTSGQLKQQIKDNEARKTRAAELVKSIDTQRAETDRWARLNEIIGSGDGKRFRVFAQGLTLQRLVRLANGHLQRLSGRYRIRKQPGESLNLRIVDTYQADFERSSTTLSGGESFLVSLALALGLSDLAGRNARIETLFIDEGFGTLDQNTLDVALTTLENLQADGKTIGIISHVKELQERIGTQIRVKKGGSGFSTLEVVG